MIYGFGVGVKYNAIIDGRRRELFDAVPPGQLDTRIDELTTFTATIRTCSMSQLNEWYELYSSVIKVPRKKRNIIEALQDHDD